MKQKEGKKSPLSSNLRLLRRKSGYSQEGLAEKLDLNRSSIAAYESKGVEPRLSVIIEIAQLFDISVRHLLLHTLADEDESFPPFLRGNGLDQQVPQLQSEPALLQDFVDKTLEVRKVVEGFKAFYDMRRARNEEANVGLRDIDNFIDILEELLTHNESFIAKLSRAN